MSSPSLEAESQVAKLRELAEIEIMLAMAESQSAEVCKHLESVLAKIDELSR